MGYAWNTDGTDSASKMILGLIDNNRESPVRLSVAMQRATMRNFQHNKINT